MAAQQDGGLGAVRHGAIRIEVLGPLRALAFGGDDPATELLLGGTKPKLLMALLVVAGQGGVSDERLTEALWPDVDSTQPSDRTSSLRAYVSRLRSVIRPHGADLVRVADGYALELGEGTTDVAEFEHLAERVDREVRADPQGAVDRASRALALWRGRAFASFEDTVMLVGPIARLDEQRARCVEDRIDALLRMGDAETAVAEARAHVADHPYRERPAAQLALGLYRSGRQRDALAELSGVTQRLRTNLGLEPGSEVAALQTAILQHDPRLETPRTPPSPTRRATATPPVAESPAADPPSAERDPRSTSPIRNDVVVGRQNEIELIEAVVDMRRSALLVGLAGSGKSTLVRKIGAQVIGRCHEHPDAPPTWPWGEILSQLRQLCPDAVEVSAALAQVEGTEPSTVFSTALAVSKAVHAAASQVSVIVIEDLHWASAPTRQLMSFVLREIATLPVDERVSIIGTTRPAVDIASQVATPPERAGDDLTTISGDDLTSISFDSNITIGPLDRAAVSTILQTRLTRPPASPVVDDVLRQTGGLALLVRRAAEELGSGRGVRLPERDALVASWLATVEPADLDVARHGAIVGVRFTERLVHIAIGSTMDTTELAAAFDRLQAAGLIERDDERPGWRFGHALLATSLADSTPPDVRRPAHLRLADHFLGVDDEVLHGDALVHHLHEAGDLAEPSVVFQVATAAARSAKRAGAHDAAARHLRVATAASERVDLDVDERFELMMLTGSVHWAAGDAATSRSFYARAADLLDAGDPRIADLAARYSGFGMTHVEIDAPGRLLLERAVALPTESRVDPGAQLRCRTRLVISDWDPATIRSDAATHVAEARMLGDRQALAWALGAQLVSSMTMLLIDERLDAAEEMLELGRELNDDGAIGMGLAHRADARAGLGFIEEASADIAQLGKLADATGQPAHRWYASHYLGALRCAQGRLDEGEALINAAFGSGQLSQGVAAIEAYSGALFMARAAMGRELELLPLLESGENPAGDGRPTGIDPWLLGRALVLGAAGRLDEARPVLTQVTATSERVPRDRIASISVAQMLLVAHRLQDADAARVAYDLLLPHAHQCCAAAGMILVGSAETFLGLGALTLGRPDEAVDRLRLGVANNDRWGLHAWSRQGREWLAVAEAEQSAAGQRAAGRRAAGQTAAEHPVTGQN